MVSRAYGLFVSPMYWMYYATLAMTEIMGRSNQSQVLWLNVTDGNPSTPGSAIYENGTPMGVALFNFLNGLSGANDLNVIISIGGGQTGQPASTPPSVRVKYLLANEVTTKVNFTWASQTLGANFKSDGRLQGQEKVVTVPCNAALETSNGHSGKDRVNMRSTSKGSSLNGSAYFEWGW